MKSIMACSFMLMSSVMSAEVVTYDFTTPGEDGTIYGFTPPTDKSNPTYVTDTPMKNGACTLTMTDNGEYIKPRIQTNGSIIYLQVQSTGIFNFSATRNITKMEFELATSSLDGWVTNVGTFYNGIWEGSAREIVINCEETNQCYISKITITLESSDTYTEVASATELAAVDDGTNVVFTSETTYIGQSEDGKYVIAKSGDGIMYFVGESALPTASKNDVISAGIKGKSTIINRIPAIVVENGYSTYNPNEPTEVSLDALDLSYIGKLVALNNVSIVSNEGELQIPSTTNPVMINNLFLSEVSATNSSQRADVVGVLAATDKNYVIHPISVVEKIYSGTEETIMPEAEVSVSNGNIMILGEWNQSDVYSIDGKLIAHNKKEVSAGRGVYLVVVDGKNVAKVMLR
ncbi:MAG: hypothetical protein ACI4BH_10545 [Muribaculaceae bacterium]